MVGRNVEGELQRCPSFINCDECLRIELEHTLMIESTNIWRYKQSEVNVRDDLTFPVASCREVL